MTPHPGDRELALYSSRDLGAVDRLRVGWHLRSCARCNAEINALEALPSKLKSRSNDLPAGLDWNRLAAEMTANIHLGLEAGECVGPVRAARPERIGWRAAVAVAGMSLVLVGAWWLNPPAGREARQLTARHSPIEIRTAPGGIELKENGSALMLMHTRGQQKPIFVSTPGSLRARFVDADTGQITIHNVYSD